MILGLVKQLRDATGCGMIDCKIALIMAKDDMNEAERLLRQFGLGIGWKTDQYIKELAEWNRIKVELLDGRTFY